MKNFQATYEDRWPHGGYYNMMYVITAENKERALELALEIDVDSYVANTKKKWTIEELESNEEYVHWISSSSS